MKTALLKNQKGFLALDFIFGISLIGGAMLIVFTLCMTLTAIEVAQYFAFSTSRTYFSAHSQPSTQETAAEAKFQALISEPVMKKLFMSNWFEFTYIGAGDFTSEYEDVLAGDTHNPFVGSKVGIKAKLLGFSVPFFGRTTSSGEGLSTEVNSYLGREPSNQECLSFNQQRWQKIKQEAGSGAGGLPEGGYFVIADNGC